MKTNMDPKSALLGVAVGALVTLSIAASMPAPRSVGRYQVGGTGSHGLVVDTVTGQVWSAYLPPNAGKTDVDFYQVKTSEKN